MSDVDPAAYWADLKKGILVTGNLSEPHVKTLKAYPFIFFDNVVSASVAYDIITDPQAIAAGSRSKIAYAIKMSEPQQGDVEVRVNAIANSVKAILWDSVDVEVVLEEGDNV